MEKFKKQRLDKRAKGFTDRSFISTARSSLYTTAVLYLLILFLPFPSLPFYVLPCAAPKAHAEATVSAATREERLAVFDDVWETIRDRYYDPSFNGLDWEAQRAEFRPLAASAHDSAELYSVLRRMIATLRDAHTRVYAPEEKFDWQHPRVVTTGLSLREVGGLPVVFSVERGSEAERAGLRAGDVITRVDGEAALTLFARRLKEADGASTAQAARLRAMALLLTGPPASTVKVEWIGSEGRVSVATLRREWRDRTAKLTVEETRDHYFIVRFDAFTNAVARDFMRAMRGPLRSARGLILDLRNNGGGDSEAMTDIASALLGPGNRLGRFTDRTGSVRIEPQTRTAMVLSADSITRYEGPVIVLTSERTASAAEIFVASVKEARRGEVLGTSTCGCVLAIRRRHVLPDGGELDVSEMDYRTSAGARLEGNGVAPDETITITATDIRARRDRAVERALEQLRIRSGD